MHSRFSAIVAMLVLVLSSLALASAAEAAPPRLVVSTAVSGKLVTFSGQARRGAAVELQRHAAGHWVHVSTSRAGRAGEFRVSTRATLGRQFFRVVVGGRPSNVAPVNPLPAYIPRGTGVTVSGRLPSSARRPVLLQRKDGAQWVLVGAAHAGRTFRIGWPHAVASIVRVLVPRQVRLVGTGHNRHRVIAPRVVSAPRHVSVPPTSDTRFTDLTPSTATGSFQPKVSGDGRAVVFLSRDRLSSLDTNDDQDVYVVDRLSGEIELISRSADTGMAVGADGAAAISADGQHVAFVTDGGVLAGQAAQQHSQVYLADRSSSTVRLVSAAKNGDPDGTARDPSVSAHGEYVAFVSDASNLVDATHVGSFPNVFLRDVVDGTTTAISVSSTDVTRTGDGASTQPSISDDGMRIAYASSAFDLDDVVSPCCAQVYLWTRATAKSVVISRHPETGVAGSGDSGLPEISADGSAVAFVSRATDLGLANPSSTAQIYLWRESAGTIASISTRDGVTGGVMLSDQPTVNGDGTRVAFETSDAVLTASGGAAKKTVVLWVRGSGLRELTRDPDGSTTDLGSDSPSLSDLGKAAAVSRYEPGGQGGIPHVVAVTFP
jgi:Tol biopolymer transport system component